MDALFEVEFEIYAENDLRDELEEDEVGEFGVDVGLEEFAAAVEMSEGPA